MVKKSTVTKQNVFKVMCRRIEIIKKKLKLFISAK